MGRIGKSIALGLVVAYVAFWGGSFPHSQVFMTHDEWVAELVTVVIDAKLGFGSFSPKYLTTVALQRWNVDRATDPREVAKAWIAARVSDAEVEKPAVGHSPRGRRLAGR